MQETLTTKTLVIAFCHAFCLRGDESLACSRSFGQDVSSSTLDVTSLWSLVLSLSSTRGILIRCSATLVDLSEEFANF